MNASSAVPPITVPIGTETDAVYGRDEEMTTAVSHNSQQVTVTQYLADTDIHTHTAKIQHCKNVSVL